MNVIHVISPGFEITAPYWEGASGSEVMVGRLERRTLLKSVTAVLACSPALLSASVPRSADVCIENVKIEFKDYSYRVPIEFGDIVSS